MLALITTVSMGKVSFLPKKRTIACFSEKWLIDNGFSHEVAKLVEGHVTAKRYLVTKDDDYYHNLSEASKETFKLQGGKLTPEEVF